MSIFQGLILGILQGLGEFLPISSSGHLLLARLLMGISDANGAYKVLDVLMHVGTLLPVAIVFWKDWMDMLFHPIKNRTLILLIVATIPTVLVYLGAKLLFPAVGGFAVFDSGWFLGVSFLITAVMLWLSDSVSERHVSGTSDKQVGFPQAILMGLMQGIGMIQGVSRSGSTISGGLLMGLDRKKAAKFSFMMSAPAILGSLLIETKDALEEGLFTELALVPTIVAIVAAAIFGFLAIKLMMKLIEKVPLRCFAIYVGLLGVVFLFLQLTGSPLVPAFVVPTM